MQLQEKWSKGESGFVQLRNEAEVAGVERDGELACHAPSHLCLLFHLSSYNSIQSKFPQIKMEWSPPWQTFWLPFH